MSSHHWPHDGLPTPPAAMKGSRSKPGGLNLDCTSGSIAGAAPSLMPLHTTMAIGCEQLRCQCNKRYQNRCTS
ncbi:hypothetical protein HaLaN_25337 [Haematococcus lacustris]|uniref:Uncharacterized protein n=1 Tax=Haematococcus lacustris TaxID=44745 RepID=A0A6A0A3G7_HAELA|nr:hypothetical protein HaLaN_25337 [Haematococcus lacustris]